MDTMSSIIINMSLAVFWLFLGGAILISEWIGGPIVRGPFDISLGWWCLLLAVFNCVRVLGIYYTQRRRQMQIDADEPARRPFAHREPRRHDEPPDPNFQFTEPPAKLEEKPPEK
jgi:hypothetical protein